MSNPTRGLARLMLRGASRDRRGVRLSDATDHPDYDLHPCVCGHSRDEHLHGDDIASVDPGVWFTCLDVDCSCDRFIETVPPQVAS